VLHFGAVVPPTIINKYYDTVLFRWSNPGPGLEHAASLNKDTDAGQAWNALWDPRYYLPSASLPMLWCAPYFVAIGHFL
jgi:hypothetical protein